jgi:hypothetical protein
MLAPDDSTLSKACFIKSNLEPGSRPKFGIAVL